MSAALLSVAQAARQLYGSTKRSDEKRVVRMCERGQLRAFRDGRRWWIVRSAIEELRAA